MLPFPLVCAAFLSIKRQLGIASFLNRLSCGLEVRRGVPISDEQEQTANSDKNRRNNSNDIGGRERAGGVLTDKKMGDGSNYRAAYYENDFYEVRSDVKSMRFGPDQFTDLGGQFK